MTPEEVQLQRKNYKENLAYVLDTIQQNTEYMVVTGPTLMGELPNYKTEMMDAYLAINKNITAEMGIDYVDTRSIYLKDLPDDWNKTYGYFTLDGEHLNRRGATKMALILSSMLSAWYCKNDVESWNFFSSYRLTRMLGYKYVTDDCDSLSLIEN